MANLRDIKKRISSVSSTKQITRTMEMVSTTKIRHALDRAKQAEPYKDAITRMLVNIASVAEDIDAPLLEHHAQEKRVLFIAIASDRGLAGGFNVAIQRGVEKRMRELEKQGIQTALITCGRKPSEYFRYRGIEPIMSFEGSSAEPTVEQAEQIASYLIDGYLAGTIDRVVLWYNHAKNRVEQTLTVETLLPVTVDTLQMPNAPRHPEAGQTLEAASVSLFKFSPSAHEVLDYLMPTYIRTVIHHALLDSAAAEHSARRRAMHSATENAEDIITTLNRTYNRSRQDSITTELNEIVGGAAALEDM